MKYHFFLGGYDAEMLEIKNILDKNGLKYFDKQLKWGAKLSDYKDEIQLLDESLIPVFIELTLDNPYPECAIIIDHHGERSGIDQKTSIEQIADLLSIRLDRHQQLISINDKSHIRGMKQWGATDEEIQKIRLMDRRAQGATEEHERLAEKSIKENIEIINDHFVFIVSLSEKTSTVIDRINDQYLHTVIISPDGNMHYFGPGETIQQLIQRLYQQKEQSHVDFEFWYGGSLPEYGYLGSEYNIPKNELIQMFES